MNSFKPLNNRQIMSLGKKHRFSEIYSHRSAINERPMLQPLRETLKKNSQRNKTEVSPIAVEIEAIDEYKQTVKIKLNREAIEKINQALAIEQQAQKSLTMREIENNMYLNYTYNPFLDNSDRKDQLKSPKSAKKQEIKPSSQKLKKAAKNIIEGWSDLRGKGDISQFIKRTQKKQSTALFVFNKMTKERQNQRKSAEARKNLKMKSYYERQVIEQPQIREQNIFEDFDRIVNMYDENYFLKKQRDTEMNILKIKFIENQLDFLPFRLILDKLHFTHDSMIAKNEKKIIDVYKEISKQSRLLLKTPPWKPFKSEFIYNHLDLNFDMDKISIKEIISIVAGQLRPDNLFKYLTEDEQTKNKKDEDSSSIDSEQNQVVYEDRHEHRGMLTKDDKNSKAQISYYHVEPLTKLDMRQEQLSVRYNEKLDRILKLKEECISMGVRDRQITQKIEKERDFSLICQLQDTVDKRMLNLGSTQRKIRANKINKNRTEKIRIDEFTKTMKRVKEFEKKFKIASKSKSPVIPR